MCHELWISMITGHNYKCNLSFHYRLGQKSEVFDIFIMIIIKASQLTVFSPQQKQTNLPKSPSQLRFHKQLNWQRQLRVILFLYLWIVTFPSSFLIRKDIFFSECNFSSQWITWFFSFRRYRISAKY